MLDLKTYLEKAYEQFNRLDFIENDPISIPHSFKINQDIEISAFFAAMLAWGNRKTIIQKCKELLYLMDNSPYEFILHHQANDLKRFLNFKHRTFNATDTLYFIHFFQQHYTKSITLESAFIKHPSTTQPNTEQFLIHFHQYFFSLEDAPLRTYKHIASPQKNSACKRLNMFLRWMVRKDQHGVDFGLWNQIKPAQLICPCDVHVERVAKKLGLISRKKSDWKTALELTENLKKLDPKDPVKYDFALFGLGVLGEL